MVVGWVSLLIAAALKEAQGIEEKAQARRALLVGQDFRVGEARMVGATCAIAEIVGDVLQPRVDTSFIPAA